MATRRHLILVVMLLILIFPSPSKASWYYSIIDSYPFGSGNLFYTPLIAIDSQNKIHIAYSDGGKGLKYATYSNNTWAISIVDKSSNISPQAIGIDSTNHVHLLCLDGINIIYFTNVSGSWLKNTINDKYNAYAVSMALDSNDKIHISCYAWDLVDYVSGLYYIENTSGQWARKLVAAIEVPYDSLVGTSIATDSDNKAHISYCDQYAASGLKYATNKTGEWKTFVVDNSNEYGGTLSRIAVDTQNKVHVGYSTGYTLGYANNVSGSWVVFKDLVNGEIGNEKISLRTDSKNRVHFCFHRYLTVSPNFSYLTNSSGNWELVRLDDSGVNNDLAIDTNDRIHIVYTDSTESAYGIMYVTSAEKPVNPPEKPPVKFKSMPWMQLLLQDE